LHSSFLSPFNNPPSKNNAETVRSYKQPAMQVAHSKIHNFSEETLFYIFYSMPNDVLQLYAAQELYNRSWRYQKAEQRWYTRVTTDGESKQVYFEPTTWDRVPKDLFGDVEILQQPHVK
jgi:CCR4-NOT transcription complex subunit 2